MRVCVKFLIKSSSICSPTSRLKTFMQGNLFSMKDLGTSVVSQDFSGNQFGMLLDLQNPNLWSMPACWILKCMSEFLFYYYVSKKP